MFIDRKVYVIILLTLCQVWLAKRLHIIYFLFYCKTKSITILCKNAVVTQCGSGKYIHKFLKPVTYLQLINRIPIYMVNKIIYDTLKLKFILLLNRKVKLSSVDGALVLDMEFHHFKSDHK